MKYFQIEKNRDLFEISKGDLVIFQNNAVAEVTRLGKTATGADYLEFDAMSNEEGVRIAYHKNGQLDCGRICSSSTFNGFAIKGFIGRCK